MWGIIVKNKCITIYPASSVVNKKWEKLILMYLEPWVGQNRITNEVQGSSKQRMF